MVANKQDCDQNVLRQFLEHQLDAKASEKLELHLGVCAACREQLENLAAAPGFWSGVGTRLGHGPNDTPVLDGSHNSRETQVSPRPLPPQEGVASIAGVQPDAGTSFGNPGSERFETHAALIAYLREWLNPSDDPESMGRLGGYEIVGVVGVGGMSVVLKGYDQSLNRYVAIKVLGTHLATSGAARKRFAREAQAAAAVVHENVLAIHAIDESKDMPYLVMPYVRGESLEKRLHREGRLQVVEVLRVARQISAGLDAAHTQGLVHRDIKPANILLDEGSERLKISDFGLARAADDASLTHSGSIAGTPLYMSPEQARGETVDHRSDLFSFGSLLYTLCTGHPPFRAETPYGIIRRICDDDPRPIQESTPEIPEWLAAIIGRMMAKSVEERFDSAAELEKLFRLGLSELQKPGTGELSRVLTRLVPSPPRERKWQPIIGPVALLASIMGLACLCWWLSGVLLKEPTPELTNHQDSPIKTSESRPTSLNEVTVNDQPQNVLTYELKPGERYFYKYDMTVEHPHYLFMMEGVIDLSVDENQSGKGTEVVFELSRVPRIEKKDGSNDVWSFVQTASSPMPAELSLLRKLTNNGRFSVSSDGTILGSTSSREWPGELGTILNWIFPRLTDDLLEPWTIEMPIQALVGRLPEHDPLAIHAPVIQPHRIGRIPGMGVTPGTRHLSAIDRMREIQRSTMPRSFAPSGFERALRDPLAGFNGFTGLEAAGTDPLNVSLTRTLKFSLDSAQSLTDRGLKIKFDGADIPESQSELDGVIPRECEGWFRFDRELGLLEQLSMRRKPVSDVQVNFSNPLVELEIERLDQEESRTYLQSLKQRYQR